MLVEIWSDVVCPWCAVGKARFARALAALPDPDRVEVRWRSFELDPTAPPERSGPYVDHLAAKYGRTRDEAQAMIDTMTATGAAEGLAFRFDRARAGNTFDAHRLLHLAADVGRQRPLVDRLFRAYLSEGEPIGDPATLRRLAGEAGLDVGEAEQVLASDRYADAVRADEQQARAYGISGVPFFVLDGRFGLSGAQPPEVLGQALERALTDRRPLTLLDAPSDTPGDDCEDGECAV